jgi:hypothetical protein
VGIEHALDLIASCLQGFGAEDCVPIPVDVFPRAAYHASSTTNTLLQSRQQAGGYAGSPAMRPSG